MVNGMRQAHACPDLETIAAFLDNRLSARERARVTAHLAECETCYELMRESAQTMIEKPARVTSIEKWRARVGRREVVAGVGGVLATAAAVWLVVGGTLAQRSPANVDDMRELSAALAKAGARSIEGRLSAALTYRPVGGPVRAGAPPSQTFTPDIRIAVANTEKSLAAKRTAPALHAFGVASAVTGDLDRAIALLEQSADRSPARSHVLSDLAAARLARAARDNSREDTEKALDAAERALQIDATSTDALFNRAVAVERLAPGDAARQAWRDYLSLDDRSGWASEARQHLQALENRRER